MCANVNRFSNILRTMCVLLYVYTKYTFKFVRYDTITFKRPKGVIYYDKTPFLLRQIYDKFIMLIATCCHIASVASGYNA